MSSEHGILIVDIDGTILVNKKRKEASIKSVLGDRHEELKDVSINFLEDTVTKWEAEEIYKQFYSGKFLHLDEPILHAATVLRKYGKGLRIAYLTSRQDAPGDSMKDGTISWLDEHEFPVPKDRDVMLFMEPGRYTRGYKDIAVSTIATMGDVVAGIGDLPHDSWVYTRNGIAPLTLYNKQYNKSDYGDKAVFVEDWKEIETWLDENTR